MSTVPQAAIDRLIAKDQITDVLFQWTRGVERQDWDLVRACYTPDAVDYHGTVNSGVDDFIEWMKSYHEHIEHVVFNSMNILIEFIDEDRAFVESHGISVQRHGPGARASRAAFLGQEWEDREVPIIIDFAGRKLDTFVRRDGQWRILSRQQVYERVEARVAPERWSGEADLLFSRRDNRDPLYEARANAGLIGPITLD